MALWEDTIAPLYTRATKYSIILWCLLAGCHPKTAAPVTPGEDALPFYNDATFTAEWIEPTSPRYKHLHTIDTFALTNQLGQTITQNTLQGHIYTANFFFTTCPGICPKMTGNLLTLQKAFENDTSVLMVSFSVTPTRDSVPVLKQYAADKGIINSKWHLLTGNETRIYNLARQSYFAEKTLGLQKSNNDFLHTETVLLIDTAGRIRGIYNATQPLDMERIIEDIQVLKKLG